MLTTSAGNIELELDKAESASVCAKLCRLCEQRFLSDTTFHRVIPGFIIQAAVSPSGSSKKTKPPIDEANNGLHNTRVSKAR